MRLQFWGDTRTLLCPFGTTTLPQQSSPAQFRHESTEDLLKAGNYHKMCQRKVQIAMQSMKTKDTPQFYLQMCNK